MSSKVFGGRDGKPECFRLNRYMTIALVCTTSLMVAAPCYALDFGALVNQVVKAAAAEGDSTGVAVNPAPSANTTSAKQDSPFVPASEYCNLVAINPALKRIASVEEQAEKNGVMGGSARRAVDELFQLGSPISNWVNEKIKNSIYATQGPNMDYTIFPAYFGEVRKLCGKNLVDSGALTLSDSSSEKREYEECKATKVKKMNDEGSVVLVPQNCDAQAARYYEVAQQGLVLPKVLAFKNGDKVLQGAAGERIAQLESELKMALADKHQFDGEQLAEKKKEEQRLAAQKNADAARLARIGEMKKSGNYAAAHDCEEIAEASGAITTLNFNPGVSADNKLYGLIAKLDELEPDAKKGFIQNTQNGMFGRINLTDKSIWKSKEKIQIHGMVEVVGRYIGNSSVQLTNGAAQQVRVYDVVCIQPFELR